MSKRFLVSLVLGVCAVTLRAGAATPIRVMILDGESGGSRSDRCSSSSRGCGKCWDDEKSRAGGNCGLRVMGGAPVVAGTRIPLAALSEKPAKGATAEEVADDQPLFERPTYRGQAGQRRCIRLA